MGDAGGSDIGLQILVVFILGNFCDNILFVLCEEIQGIQVGTLSSLIFYNCFYNYQKVMHKIGILMMGKMGVASPKKVKEIILEVEGKTKMINIAEYLLEMKKISDLNVEFSLEKNGRPVS